MKKTITLTFLIMTFLLGSHSAEACSPDPTMDYPTVNDVLKGGGIITLGKSLADGRVVAAERVESTSINSPLYFIMQAPGHSCTERFSKFNEGEYVVSVTTDVVTMLYNTEFDNEFTYYFDNVKDAELKYDELIKKINPDIFLTNQEKYIPAGYTLRPGMKNDDVAELQKGLNNILGISLVVDGDYGRGTMTAVIDFQRKYSLFPDGIAGAKTQEKLSIVAYPVINTKPIMRVDKMDEFGRTIASECQVASFCNGPIECLNADIDTSAMVGTCEYRESYACYKNAGNICEVQSTGNCGWTVTDELQICITDTDLDEE